MTLGMNKQELEKFYDDEYNATFQRRQGQQKKIADDLITHGIPEIEAKKDAMYQIRQVSTVQALLLTILENNAKIDS